MSRAGTGSEGKRASTGTIASVSNQRLIAASKRALESHARVARLAEHLNEELDHVTSPQGVPVTNLDPEDSMVIAVEKVIASAKVTTPPPFGEAEKIVLAHAHAAGGSSDLQAEYQAEVTRWLSATVVTSQGSR